MSASRDIQRAMGYQNHCPYNAETQLPCVGWLKDEEKDEEKSTVGCSSNAQFGGPPEQYLSYKLQKQNSQPSTFPSEPEVSTPLGAKHPPSPATKTTNLEQPLNALHTPPTSGRKRPFADVLDENEDCFETPRRKLFSSDGNLKSTPSKKKVVFLKGCPEFSIAYKASPPKQVATSAVEIRRLAESVLDQVDWQQAALDTATNRGVVAYKRIVKELFQAKVDGLSQQESGEKSGRV